MKKALVGIGMVVILGTACTTKATTSSSTGSSAPTTAAAPARPAPSPTWKTVATFSGTGNQNTDPFTLTSAPARIVYNVTGADPSMVLVNIYVLPQGRDLQTSGGFPTVTAETTGTNSTNIESGKGTYYLDVMAANAGWTAVIQQES